jgi:hypothetical protein
MCGMLQNNGRSHSGAGYNGTSSHWLGAVGAHGSEFGMLWACQLWSVLTCCWWAGLACARQLRAFGFKVMVLEGHDRPGGRVYTKKMEVSGLIPPTAFSLHIARVLFPPACLPTHCRELVASGKMGIGSLMGQTDCNRDGGITVCVCRARELQRWGILVAVS